MARVWSDFVRTSVPVREWQVRDTLPEKAFQELVLRCHGSLAKINAAYGLKLSRIEELTIPFGEALLVTFRHRERAFEIDGITGNYRAVIDYLFHRGDAVRNTLILVLLSALVTLTVNPLAGYALSRFRLRSTERLIVFCLATMAFPAAVSAIPGFLLLRDFGMLNTFAALVLPGAANGMTIFLLKGFFDSLPRELYEAATIDGAGEWTIFTVISLPLVKPILAVSLLNSFLAAYNGWEWAIVVCQDPRMWTVAVWTYQFYQALGGQQFVVMAAFVLNSLPVLLVFLFCQKIILRGIILPQMK
jgi:multiple sugar transport system permease protein